MRLWDLASSISALVWVAANLILLTYFQPTLPVTQIFPVEAMLVLVLYNKAQTVQRFHLLCPWAAFAMAGLSGEWQVHLRFLPFQPFSFWPHHHADKGLGAHHLPPSEDTHLKSTLTTERAIKTCLNRNKHKKCGLTAPKFKPRNLTSLHGHLIALEDMSCQRVKAVISELCYLSKNGGECHSCSECLDFSQSLGSLRR